MIKICHIVNLITGKSDGVFSHLMMIIKNHDKFHFEHFVIFQGGKIVEDRLSKLNIKCYTVKSLKQKYSIKSIREIYQIIKAENPDILHTHLIKPYILTGLINIILRKKMIFNYHGSFIVNDYNTYIEKLVYKLFHKIIELTHPTNLVLVPSARSKELLETETIAFKTVVVYYNGYEKSESNDSKDQYLLQKINNLKSERKKIICSIGRLNREKRIDRAIMICHKMLNRGVEAHLFIFGEGETELELKNIVKQYNLEDNVTFTGYIEEAERFLKFFDLLLITSDREGMPFVIWEAMGNEVAVSAPNVGGIKEILVESNCGLIYETGDLNEAVEETFRLLDDEMHRKKLGENGKKAVESIFNERNFITQIEKSYTYLLAR